MSIGSVRDAEGTENGRSAEEMDFLCRRPNYSSPLHIKTVRYQLASDTCTYATNTTCATLCSTEGVEAKLSRTPCKGSTARHIHQ